MPQRIYAPGQVCAFDGCPKLARHRGWCSTHYERWRRHGSPDVTLKTRDPKLVTYSTVHQWLPQQRGRAADHTCVDCGQPARSWSYSHLCPEERLGYHGPKLMPYCHHIFECYAARCEPCHTRYDAGR